jgi:hypothetical protein
MLLYMHVHFLIITYIHTYIMYIFRVSISMCKCSYDSILLYSYIYGIHVKVYYYCLTLNCYCPISNYYCLHIELLLSNCYCLTLNCYCLHIELLLSNRYCLTWNCYCLDVWTVTVQPLLSRHLNCYCLHIEMLLSNCYCLDIELLLSNCYCLDIWTVTIWTLIRFLTISKVLKLHFKWDWSR